SAIFPTRLAPASLNRFFTFSCALIHIFLHPLIVITGVFLRSVLNEGCCNSELAGMLGDKNQGWYPIIIRSYCVSLNARGSSSVGMPSTLSGITSKNAELVHGKGNCFAGQIRNFST